MLIGISSSTVRQHLHRLRQRLGIVGAGQSAVMFARMIELGWLTPEEIGTEAQYSTWLAATARDDTWRPSAAQCCYLHAFTRLLRHRDAESAAAMDLAFQLMCWEAGVPVPPRRLTPNAIDVGERVECMLLTLGRALCRPLYDDLPRAA